MGENIRIVTDVDANKNKNEKHNICESDNFMHTCESVHKENFNSSKHVLPPNAERMSLFWNECGQPIQKKLIQTVHLQMLIE